MEADKHSLLLFLYIVLAVVSLLKWLDHAPSSSVAGFFVPGVLCSLLGLLLGKLLDKDESKDDDAGIPRGVTANAVIEVTADADELAKLRLALKEAEAKTAAAMARADAAEDGQVELKRIMSDALKDIGERAAGMTKASKEKRAAVTKAIDALEMWEDDSEPDSKRRKVR
eukprot:gnl/TRDRNA2_/TRDRNA2_85898_c0_seq1.p1 gnl/TRDRNA2_/TRDRNA2_85898_c0~~gnl/TRDRNA2_/TRDRNA2_85898_c0_seq1.p1  ORF type:complete len:170 (+),score=47.80 gnl/TRDRNA2_/TRDRNA2_85898_c0_seq1:86-595(+)